MLRRSLTASSSTRTCWPPAHKCDVAALLHHSRLAQRDFVVLVWHLLNSCREEVVHRGEKKLGQQVDRQAQECIRLPIDLNLPAVPVLYSILASKNTTGSGSRMDASSNPAAVGRSI